MSDGILSTIMMMGKSGVYTVPAGTQGVGEEYTDKNTAVEVAAENGQEVMAGRSR